MKKNLPTSKAYWHKTFISFFFYSIQKRNILRGLKNKNYSRRHLQTSSETHLVYTQVWASNLFCCCDYSLKTISLSLSPSLYILNSVSVFHLFPMLIAFHFINYTATETLRTRKTIWWVCKMKENEKRKRNNTK